MPLNRFFAIAALTLLTLSTLAHAGSKQERLNYLVRGLNLQGCDSGCQIHALSEIRALLNDNSVDPNFVDPIEAYPTSLLHDAVMWAKRAPFYSAVAKLLLAHPRIDVNASGNSYARAPILRALQNNDVALLRQFVAHPGIDINVAVAGDPNATPIIHVALRCLEDRAGEMFEMLLSHPGIDVNNPTSKDSPGASALSIAAEQGCRRHVELLIAFRGTDLFKYQPRLHGREEFSREAIFHDLVRKGVLLMNSDATLVDYAVDDVRRQLSLVNECMQLILDAQKNAQRASLKAARKTAAAQSAPDQSELRWDIIFSP